MTPTDPDIALDELIADWRQSGTTRPLPDWLGVPEDVYADWDEGRVTAGALLASRRADR